MTQARVLLATGGTGGHIFPAVALARALEVHGVNCAVIGGAGGMEERVAAQEQLTFFGVRTGKLDRARPDPRALLRAVLGFWDALKVVAGQKPAVVVGFGGFASFPGVAAAVLRGVPLLLHEGNARPGLVTKFLGRFARQIALVDENARHELPRAQCVWVGMPVREVSVPRAVALQGLGLDAEKRLVLVMGGSQGSMRLNQLLPPILEQVLAGLISAGQTVQVLHQTGRGRLEEVAPRVAHLPWYRCAEFVDGPSAWSAASMAITRAGYGTIADAAFHGVPLVMVPLPSSAEDHQTKNALSVEGKGAGFVVSEVLLEQEFSQGSNPVQPGLDGQASTLFAPLKNSILRCLDPLEAEQLRLRALASSPQGAAVRLAALVLACMSEGLVAGTKEVG